MALGHNKFLRRGCTHIIEGSFGTFQDIILFPWYREDLLRNCWEKAGVRLLICKAHVLNHTGEEVEILEMRQ